MKRNDAWSQWEEELRKDAAKVEPPRDDMMGVGRAFAFGVLIFVILSVAYALAQWILS